MTPRVIDMHNHGFPRAFLDAVRRGEGEPYGVLVEKKNEEEALVLPDGQVHAVQSKRAEYGRQVDELAAAGIEASAFSVMPYLSFSACGEEAAAWACRKVNESMAEAQREFPGQLYGMAMMPLPYGRAAAEEMDYAATQLGLRAVQLLTKVDSRQLDDPEFLPFWERAEAHGVVVFLHPPSRREANALVDYYLFNLIGNPTDTAVATGRLIFGGVMARYPGLNVLLAHGGGSAPPLIGRWRHGYEHRPEPREQFQGDFDAVFHRLYVDTLVYEPKMLRYLLDLMGTDHVVLGTDYSGDMSSWRTQVADLRALDGLMDDEKDAILGGTGARLLGLNQ